MPRAKHVRRRWRLWRPIWARSATHRDVERSLLGPGALANDDVMVIPKTGRRERLRENLGALERPLSAAQLAELDRLFPAPPGARPLEMI